MSDGSTQEQARVDQRDIPMLYDRLAHVYDLWAALTESTARRRALQQANPTDGENVLEIAIGTGQTLAALAAANPTGITHGSDISMGMLTKARQRLSKLRGQLKLQIALADAYALPFADRSFDLVIVSYLFDLLSEQDFPDVIAELHRVLRDTGRVVVTNMTIAERHRDNLYRWVYRLHPKLLGGCRGVRLTPDLATHGFHVIQRDYITQLGFPSEILLARPAVTKT